MSEKKGKQKSNKNKNNNVMSESIHDVSAYLKWIKEHRCSEDDVPFELTNVYYRGHANKTWHLTPTLFREPRIIEYNAIRTAALRMWKPCSRYDCLERLIYFQHYGLKTRLLDVTYNPLVALYFACQEDKEHQEAVGEVLYGYCDNEQSLQIASIIGNLVSTVDFSSNVVDKKWIERFKEEHNIHYPTDVFCEMLCNPVFVDPPYNSDRIIAQQGAFVMAPLFEEKDKGLFWYRNNYEFKRGGDNDFFATGSIRIPSDYKKDILEELDCLNINESTIFKDAEHTMRTINKRFETKYQLDS